VRTSFFRIFILTWILIKLTGSSVFAQDPAGNYSVYWPDSFAYADYGSYRIPLKRIIDSLRVNLNTINVLIDKSDNKLAILSGSKTLKEFPVMFGQNSSDDKLMQGDGCTPEGSFKMLSKYPHKKWEKFIYINYPNEDSRKKHNLAKKEGRIPPDAKIGGDIGIHGIGGDKELESYFFHKSFYSAGCIMLKNDDINEIFPYFDTSTKIVIRK
jgi:murein L,D-transpeptidase YafK